ncbi:hypothetical protein [Roseicella sp. DB1501]|uniref:hypothetical protein n=1 Tax=Roseicella sp. DB1501 TaxID=2730925 RepID=UPI001490A549|nr:hypothetical protein [Roseicella sp. DB1501]NOG72247.1 hypothetical protein [Roseicella sp. DB1501]
MKDVAAVMPLAQGDNVSTIARVMVQSFRVEVGPLRIVSHGGPFIGWKLYLIAGGRTGQICALDR